MITPPRTARLDRAPSPLGWLAIAFAIASPSAGYAQSAAEPAGGEDAGPAATDRREGSSESPDPSRPRPDASSEAADEDASGDATGESGEGEAADAATHAGDPDPDAGEPSPGAAEPPVPKGEDSRGDDAEKARAQLEVDMPSRATASTPVPVAIPPGLADPPEPAAPDRSATGWFENPQSTRYFFGTNALGLEKGSGYYQNSLLFFNNINYGVTEQFSLGAGGLLVPGIPVAWILPKVSVSLPNDLVHFAAGAMLGGASSRDETGGLGILYGASTLGNRDTNVTVGLGYGYGPEGILRTPLITVSGMLRVHRNLFLVTENYSFASALDRPFLWSAGLRLAGETVAADFGLVDFFPNLDFPMVPWLGLTIPFDR